MVLDFLTNVTNVTQVPGRCSRWGQTLSPPLGCELREDRGGGLTQYDEGDREGWCHQASPQGYPGAPGKLQQVCECEMEECDRGQSWKLDNVMCVGKPILLDIFIVICITPGCSMVLFSPIWWIQLQLISYTNFSLNEVKITEKKSTSWFQPKRSPCQHTSSMIRYAEDSIKENEIIRKMSSVNEMKHKTNGKPSRMAGHCRRGSSVFPNHT